LRVSVALAPRVAGGGEQVCGGHGVFSVDAVTKDLQTAAQSF
jgi:hypothetical protein